MVGCASNGREALTLCEELQPDLVLMDIIMPELNGVEAIQLIKAKYGNKIKVVILTTFNEEEYVVTAIANGADSFILKDIQPAELFRTIKSTVAGLSIIEESSLSSMVKQIKTPKNIPQVSLTDREKILRLIVDGKDNKTIAAELF